MFTMRVEDAIKALVEAYLPLRPNGNDKALYIGLYCFMKNPHKTTLPASASSCIHLIFSRKTNFTKVFSCINNSWVTPAAKDFIMKIDHDCWMPDGLRDIVEVYFDLANMIREDKAPADMEQHVIIDKVRLVDIEMVKDPSDQYNYRLLLKSINSSQIQNV